MLVNIGPCPPDENCIQVGDENYIQRSREECKRYRDLLIKTFGEPSDGNKLVIKGFEHDFGTYYEVCVKVGNKEGMEYALKLESQGPLTWEG